VEGATRFVFRERKITRLMEICTRLKAIESLIPGKVVILQDAGEEKSLRPDELGIKVTKLDPVSDDVHDAILKKGTLAQKRGSCLYHQNAECRRFVFETPFTKSGRAHAKSTAEQYLRRTICTVVERFPTSEKLQPIVSEEHVDLEPIEAATKAIREKVRDLTLKAFPLEGQAKLKTLYQVLSGAVNPQVHGGVIEVRWCSTEGLLIAEHVMLE